MDGWPEWEGRPVYMRVQNLFSLYMCDEIFSAFSSSNQTQTFKL